MFRPYLCALMIVLLLVFSGCATLPTDFERPVSYALTDTDNTALGKMVSGKGAQHPGMSGLHLLGNGLDAFVARVVLAQKAERSIDVQYYLYHDDLVGRLFTDQLLKAADRGVRVRALVDDMDMSGRDLGLAAANSHPNVEVRIFHPFSRETGRTWQFVAHSGTVTRRMHCKSFTVDNQVSILGGRNIGNEYFEADPDLAFADLDVIAMGQAARDVSTAFDKYWNSELAYPVSVLIDAAPTPAEIDQQRQRLNDFVADQANSDYLQALRHSQLADQIRQGTVTYYWGDAELLYDQPEKVLHDIDDKAYHLAPALAPYLKSLEKELIIFSPYFVPGKAGTALLTDLAQRGIRVRILTNSLASNDVGIVHAGYIKYRKALLRAGVELYEMNKKLSKEERKEKKGVGGSSKASLHAKSFVFDRKQVFVGSLNLDPRALVYNTEIGVIFSSEEAACTMSDWFDEHIDQLAFKLELRKDQDGYEQILWHGMVDGKPQTFDVEPYTGFWRRFGIGFMSIFPIQGLL